MAASARAESESAPAKSVRPSAARRAAADEAAVDAAADVSALDGIGPARAKKLHAAGVGSVEALANLGADQLAAVAKAHGLPVKSMRRWWEQAQSASEGI